MATLIIGIDPGTHTGIAVYDKAAKEIIYIKTVTIVEAIDKVRELKSGISLVRFEDARLRRWYGNSGREQLQGAGSIKRDCTIWEEFLKAEKIPFEAVAPRNIMTKMEAGYFAKLTGYTGRTSEHSRDAAMLVWGR